MWGQDGGGGGFVDGGSTTPSQFSSPAQGRKERRSQNIVAVTIKTINDTEGESVIIGGCEASMIVIVGIIRSVEVSSTKITYVIDDSTGTIEGVQWLENDSDFDNEAKRPLMEMTYCKLIGSLRTQMGKKHVMIFNLVPITDINRITTHLLEVIHDTLKLKQLHSEKPAGIPTTPNNFQNYENRNVGMTPQSNFGGNVSSSAMPDNAQGLNGPIKLVYQYIKSSTDERGIHKNQIYTLTKGKIAENSVNKFLDELSSEGLIFNSIDDDHYKCSDSF